METPELRASLESPELRASLESPELRASLEARQIKKKKINRDDNVILIMGPPGVGKSNFIDKLLGGRIRVGNGLNSYTSQIAAYEDKGALSHLGMGKITIIETPGFGDTTKTDYEILASVSEWMSTAYQNKYKISAIIYLHRITDNRIGGTPLHNLRMFGKLTGEAAAAKVWMVTTMWDQLKISEGAARTRQADLEARFWRPLIDLGAQTDKFYNTSASAQRILDLALNTERRHAPERTALLLQEEMEELKKRLEETAAGKELFDELQRQLHRQKETLLAFQEQVKGTKNEGASKALESQLRSFEAELEKTYSQLEKLKVSVLRKLFIFLRPSSTKAIEL